MNDSNEQPKPSEAPQRPLIGCPKCGKHELQLLQRKRENEGQFQIGTLAAPQETKAIVCEYQCLTCNHRFTHRLIPPRQ